MSDTAKAHMTPAFPGASEFSSALHKLRATSFPWLLLLCCWYIFFALENKMTAPLTALEDRDVSEVAQQVSDGDLGHKFLTVALGGMGLFLWIRYRKRMRIHGPMASLFAIYLLWMGLGIFSADDPELTIRRLGGFALNLLLCAGCALRMDVDGNSIFVAAIPTLTLIPDVIAELQYHGLQALTSAGRFGGTYPHPNVAAAAIALPVIAFAWLALRARGRARVVFVSLDAVAAFFLLLTRSRTSILALLAAIGFSAAILLLRSQKKHLGRLTGVSVLLVGITGLAGLAANSTHDGLNVMSALGSNRDEGDPTTLTGRVDLWKTCLEYASERPILGFGFGGFWSAKHIESISEEQKWPINQSHSAYIDLVLAMGFPGAVLHIAILFSALAICTIRFFRYQDGFGAWAGLLVFILFNGLAEAISLAPGFLNFVLSLIWVQLALVKPNVSGVARNPLPEKPRKVFIGKPAIPSFAGREQNL